LPPAHPALGFGSIWDGWCRYGGADSWVNGDRRGNARQGPFGATTEDLLSLQLFVIVLSFPVLFLAALIEDRNSVADALREREERIGLAAETANFALWAIDFERGESWMSEKGRELFGFAPNDLLSRETFLERVHPEDRHFVDEAIEVARAGSKTFEIECRLSHPDGETRWLITRGRYLRNERGKVTELIGVAIDVTGKVQANLELRRRQEEVARLGRVALMGELTASLAHELNQPLASIANNAAAGRRFLAGGTANPQLFDALLADVSSDARRAGDVIRGIRDLVRKGAEMRCAVDLNASVREALRLLRSDLVEHGMTVENEARERSFAGSSRSGSTSAGVAQSPHERRRSDARDAGRFAPDLDFHPRIRRLRRGECA
jgi:PAS domain S-box-containing protein